MRTRIRRMAAESAATTDRSASTDVRTRTGRSALCLGLDGVSSMAYAPGKRRDLAFTSLEDRMEASRCSMGKMSLGQKGNHHSGGQGASWAYNLNSAEVGETWVWHALRKAAFSGPHVERGKRGGGRVCSLLRERPDLRIDDMGSSSWL